MKLCFFIIIFVSCAQKQIYNPVSRDQKSTKSLPPSQENLDVQADEFAKNDEFDEPQKKNDSSPTKDGQSKKTKTQKTTLPDNKTSSLEEEINCDDFNWEQITQAREVTCFSSIQSILDSLPPGVRPFWVMIRGSESGQQATQNEPRVLIYDPAGRYILGFETIKDSVTVEVAVFNFEDAVWDFTGLNFQPNADKPKTETESCKVCHSINPRPIWGSYVRWDGAIAAQGNLNTEEVTFLNAIRTNPTHLVFQALSYKPNYTAGIRLRPNHRETAENSQMLNFILARNGGLAFAHHMMNDENLNHDDRIKIAQQLLCYERGYNDSVALLNSYNHDFNRFFGFHKESTGRPFRMHVGFSPAEMHGGLFLAKKVFEDEAAYQQQYPNLYNTVSNLPAILSIEKTSRFVNGWDAFEFSFSQSNGYGRNQNIFDCSLAR
ncbi:MAG: hypothetical protein AB8C84_06960 [Oligoflexales bacterium]